MYEWKIIDGNDPFLSEFPQMHTVNEPLASFWDIIDGEDPFRQSFPQMYVVDDAPYSFWRIIDGDDPFRLQFPPMYKVRKEVPIKLKARKFHVTVYNYKQKVVLNSTNTEPEYYQRVIVKKWQPEQNINEVI